jgi:hypothetical protein
MGATMEAEEESWVDAMTEAFDLYVEGPTPPRQYNCRCELAEEDY